MIFDLEFDLEFMMIGVVYKKPTFEKSILKSKIEMISGIAIALGLLAMANNVLAEFHGNRANFWQFDANRAICVKLLIFPK